VPDENENTTPANMQRKQKTSVEPRIHPPGSTCKPIITWHYAGDERKAQGVYILIIINKKQEQVKVRL
jgi:hypothetical protein